MVPSFNASVYLFMLFVVWLFLVMWFKLVRVLYCFRMCFNLCVGRWVGDASWDVALKSTVARDVACRRVRGVTSPFDLVSEQASSILFGRNLE